MLTPVELIAWLGYTISVGITYVHKVIPKPALGFCEDATMPIKKPLALKKRIHSFKIDPADAESLAMIQERDGIPKSEQIRRGIAMWLQSKGVVRRSVTKTAPQRKRTKKR